MKKSWHPLLLKNQERVWLEEKKAVRSTDYQRQGHILIVFPRSSKKRRSLTSCGRRRRKNVSSRNSSVYRKSRQGRNDKRS